MAREYESGIFEVDEYQRPHPADPVGRVRHCVVDDPGGADGQTGVGSLGGDGVVGSDGGSTVKRFAWLLMFPYVVQISTQPSSDWNSKKEEKVYSIHVDSNSFLYQ